MRVVQVAALTGLIAIVSGALITSQKVSLQPGRPEPSAGAHRIVAYLLILLICAACTATRSGSRRIVLGGALLCLIAAALTAWTPAALARRRRFPRRLRAPVHRLDRLGAGTGHAGMESARPASTRRLF
jgi:hypothetical protein